MKGRPRQLLLICALIIALAVSLCADEKKIIAPAATITKAELRDHVYYLASDALAGRGSGTKGFDIAADYCASQFKAAGLVPIVSNSEGETTYLQRMDMTNLFIGRNNYLHTARDGRKYRLAHGDKYILLYTGEGENRTLSNSPPVFAGYGIYEPDEGWDDYRGICVEGKIVLVMFGPPMKHGKPVFSKEGHKKYSAYFESIKRKAITAAERGAAALIVVPNNEISLGWGWISDLMSHRRPIFPGDTQEQGIKNVPIPVAMIHSEAVKPLFKGRTFNPLNNKGKYGSFELCDTSMTLAIDVRREPRHTYNVVAMLPGTDSELRRQYITVGAHLDHLGTRDGMVYNGADDNASGCVGVIEVAEAAAMAPPRRPVIFILYTAEELGLVGSRHFVNNCPVPIENVMVNINMDMIGRGDFKLSETGGVYAIGSARICPELKEALLESSERVGISIDFSRDKVESEWNFGGSDHASYHDIGIPSVFFHTGLHSDFHMPTDDVDKIDVERLQRVAHLVYDLVIELGNRDKPLCFDKP